MAQYVIYVPGLADRINRRIGQATALGLWRLLYGIRVHYFVVGWADQNESFEQKLQRLIDRIDKLLAKGHTVSLVSVSAGASLAMVAFHNRPAVSCAVSICGKLRNPQIVGDIVYATNPSFKASLAHYGELEAQLEPELRKRVLCVQPKQDSLVPIGDNYIDGATISHIPSKGHVLSILAALTFFSAHIVRFIREQAKNLPSKQIKQK